MVTSKNIRADWRADLRGIDNLADVDIGEMLVFMRHQFLSSARDLILNPEAEEGERLFGENCLETAEALQMAIDLHCPWLNYANEW